MELLWNESFKKSYFEIFLLQLKYNYFLKPHFRFNSAKLFTQWNAHLEVETLALQSKTFLIN